MPLRLFFFILALIGDWPQFLGPTRNGVSPETVGWPPVVVWRKDAGEGFAAPVVANGKLIFFYRANGKEIIDCLDASSGAKVWSYDYPATYRDGVLYGFHGRQEESQALRCVRWRTGKMMWDVDGCGAGTVTLAGDRLLILRDGFRPTGKASILNKMVRAYPALADGKLYARDEKTLACVRLK